MDWKHWEYFILYSKYSKSNDRWKTIIGDFVHVKIERMIFNYFSEYTQSYFNAIELFTILEVIVLIHQILFDYLWTNFTIYCHCLWLTKYKKYRFLSFDLSTTLSSNHCLSITNKIYFASYNINFLTFGCLCLNDENKTVVIIRLNLLFFIDVLF